MEGVPKLLSERALHVLMALAIGAAGSLFLLETGSARKPHAPPPVGSTVSARPAPSYSELRDLRRGQNGAMYVDAFAALGFDGAPVPADEAKQRAAALSARARHRAYDGAPPTIPHAVSQREPTDCLACHARGARIADKIAHPLSHPEYASCTQCHVVRDAPAPLKTEEPENTFEGLASYGAGQRALAGAPPTIPHPTGMRSRCVNCHGPNGLFGLRTPHPERQSCEQCHAPSAGLDQRELDGLGPIGFAGPPR